MTTDFSRILEKSPEGFQAMGLALYIAAGVVLASHWVDITGVSLFVGGIIITVLAWVRKSDAAGTSYQSHFANIAKVLLIYMVLAIILMTVTIGTLGLGIVITWPLAFLLLLWCAYRLIKGLLRINEGAPYG
jgi:uncharacterized membrane protein